MTGFTRSAGDLIRERSWRPGKVWQEAAQRLARPPAAGLNTAFEVADKWAEDTSRVAITVRHSATSPPEHWTYTELTSASKKFAGALLSLGAGQGDRIAAVLPQGIEAHITALAVWRIGAVLVPLYPGFGAQGLAIRLAGAAPVAVVTDRDSVGPLTSALAEANCTPAVIQVGGDRGSAGSAHREFWTEVHANEPAHEIADTAAGDTATLLYTSGTTGIPKGCELPHSYLLTLQPFVRHTFALTDDDLFASTSSPGWVNGLYSTGACVMAEGKRRLIYTGRFDAADWLDIIRQEGVTYLSAAPSALRPLLALCETEGFPPTLRGGASAGEAQGKALSSAWSKFCNSPLQDAYGTTEVGLVMATPAFDQNPQPPGALPVAVPGFEIRLLDDSGVEQQHDGIIAVRNVGYVGCTGYFGRNHEWNDRWRGEWYLTGDLAHRDENGQLWFQGRDDDLIVSSGYNIGPAEVESVIAQHSGVREVAVLAAPDVARGSVVRAVVVKNTQAPPDDVLSTELKDLVKLRLGRHAYPRVIDFVPVLPRNHAGKVERNTLRGTENAAGHRETNVC